MNDFQTCSSLRQSQTDERLRKLKLDGPDADVKDPEWARLLKWWLIPFPDRPPFP